MVEYIKSIFDNTEFSQYGDTHQQKIATLLKGASDDDIASLATQLQEEQDRRLEEAEKKLAAMRKAFGRPESPSPKESGPGSKATIMNKSAVSPKRKQKKTAKAKEPRAPRGQAKELLLAFLESGPKGRKQTETHFAKSGLSAASVATLLNRLKKDGVITHDKVNKQYSKASNNVNDNGIDTSPQSV